MQLLTLDMRFFLLREAQMNKKIIPYISLFTSLGTLACCALPALFVTLGFGATLVSLLGSFPQLIWISEHKDGVFIVAGTLLALNFGLKFNVRNKSCPLDPGLTAQCKTARQITDYILLFSVITFIVGAFFAYFAHYFVKI